MIELIKKIFKPITGFLSSPIKRRFLFLVILVLAALIEFLILGLARRTFVFYTVDNGEIVVEDRMLKHSASREEDIIRYTEETLLGPVSPDLLPLFPRDTKLKSLLYRKKAVYIDFTESAALIPLENRELRSTIGNFRTLYDSILRNFSYVKDVRFFIEGNAVLLGASGDFNADEEHPDALPDQADGPDNAGI
ncbi:MAG: GerMN domain-containing protein [Treponema sp.]|nr:GerMN domain-containing protein [Treponema sp.]MCL2252710.1 GerMN domain-containing protein [Treponema sp.]